LAKIAVIVGSVRKDRQGIKVARWLEQKLNDRNHTVLASNSNLFKDYFALKIKKEKRDFFL